MLLLVRNLIRREPTLYYCEVELDGKALTISVLTGCNHPSIRSMCLTGISPDDIFELTHADEYRAFMKAFWQAVDGEAVHFPFNVVSDWASTANGGI